ncbi:GAF domain-containing protein [Amycolatopsis bartoniae]|uniref:GAF domain-containing protein n=1 Tax=Amycolatopsis bartoniae TaxID=941986 RepID=A0A8H9IYE0_9PSEU|nr:GAF domain-containing protein [Amycolatopsis bartoniae]MBB2939349.1 GAF domain-containing protein [Amycolatopsis bartoniae]TVT06727.1 GAF domain-containing protein [Amycolatopsis bartoniae]GHF83693.1 GAF domain-containing protein [Amycolatopsis bartoniae]
MTELSTVEEKVRAEIGARLFTVLAWVPERRTMRRVHTSHPEQYPVGGEKSVEITGGWLERCIVRQEPFFGPDLASVREVFADHELIDSLGCGAVINVPVVDGGETLGALAILDAEGAYDEASVEAAVKLAPLAVAALRELR